MNQDQIKYETLEENDIDEASIMIMQVFNEFVAQDYSDEGNKIFYDFISNDSMKKRLKQNNFSLVAKIKSRIVGIIEIGNNNHICLLFVKKELQRNGISKILFSIAKKKCIENKNDVKVIDVHSSLFAVPIYAKLGFVVIGSEKQENGIRYIPMEYHFK